MKLWLQSITAENLRGYTRASFNLERKCTILVGENNAGKTSILKLLDWVLSRVDVDELQRGAAVSPQDLDLLLPARSTRNRPRRLELRVKVADGRRRTRLQCDAEGSARLRINLKLTPTPRLIVKLGAPTRGENDAADPHGIQLLKELREAVLFIYVPSFRDAGSPRFQETLRLAVRSRLSERALHASQSGRALGISCGEESRRRTGKDCREAR